MLAISKKSRTAPDRYPSGDRKQPIAPALVYRLREHGVSLGMDPRLGTVLGVMNLRKELSDAEVAAGWKAAEVVGRYEMLKGIPRRHSASPSYESGFGAKAADPDKMDPDQRKRHERAVRRATKAYDQLVNKLDRESWALVERVCCDDEHIAPVLKVKLGEVLHRLATHYGMVTERQSKKPGSPRADAALIANAAIEALGQMFSKAGAFLSFSLVPAPAYATERTVSVTDGKTTETVSVPRRGVPAKDVDAQIRLAAAVKGWGEIKQEEK